ncbi:LAQU0S02e09406g1_1 [Lachancea quebecensis]|uniref:LAQU0S02e09406g1_1 n=1 Tax=Lachancea quebecensis TaxID=1654605 RepID=A0A0P1KNU4_9SACH|nr:LAQU0S02e09406g1_1 [Lachancea quebecensis]
MPNWDHVVYRDNDIDYYVPSLFYLSPTFQTTVPCFVCDLSYHFKRSKTITQKYYSGEQDAWLYGNYPISSVEVLGCVVGWKWKLIGERDNAMFKLDDSTREPQGPPTLLNVKCSKGVVLRSGLPLADLSGWTLKLVGQMNRFAELDVQSVKICSELQDEIEFWHRAIKWRKKLSAPWTVEKAVLDRVCAPTSEAPSSTYTFVQWLEQQHYQREMKIAEDYSEEPREIVLPFKHVSQDMVLDDRGAKLGPQTGCCEKTQIKKLEVHARTRASELVETFGQVAGPRISIHDYVRHVLDHLLTQNRIEVSTLNTFRSPGPLRVLRRVAAQRARRQARPVDEIASSIFADVLQRLACAGLISVFAQGRILNLRVLKNCDDYVAQRIAALVKLRSYTGKIDFRRACDLFGLARSAPLDRLLVDLHKRALRRLAAASDTPLQSWWIELAGPTAAFVRFEYHRDPVPLAPG